MENKKKSFFYIVLLIGIVIGGFLWFYPIKGDSESFVRYLEKKYDLEQIQVLNMVTVSQSKFLIFEYTDKELMDRRLGKMSTNGFLSRHKEKLHTVRSTFLDTNILEVKGNYQLVIAGKNPNKMATKVMIDILGRKETRNINEEYPILILPIDKSETKAIVTLTFYDSQGNDVTKAVVGQ